MAKKNLTRAAIEALSYDPAGPSRQVAWDGKVRGFGCRVTPAGSRQYVLSYRFNGRPRLMSLGPLDHFRSLEEARAKAESLLHGLRHDGVDPLSTRESLSNAETVEALWAIYEREHLSKLALQTRLNLRVFRDRHIMPSIGGLKPVQLTAPDLTRLHDKISRSARVSANRCVTRLAHFLDWAAQRDEHLFPVGWRNPARKVGLHRETPRGHFLTVEQMRTLLTALQADPDPFFAGFIQLLLFTAARKAEVLNLTWEQVDLPQRVARIQHTKSGAPLAMPLPEPAVRLLESLPRIDGNPHVFPSPITRGAAMWAPRLRFKALLKRLGLPMQTSFHDLRRSVGCALAAAGYSEVLISGMLNNTAAVAARHYIKLASGVTAKIAEQHAAALTGPQDPLATPAKSLPSNTPQ